MFDSLQLYELQPSRFLCPWNFPGKNTGVCCHSFLQGIFPIQGSNPRLLCPQQWQADSFQLSHLRNPDMPQLILMTIKFKITLLSFCLLNERIGRYHISYFLNEIFTLAIINEKQGENCRETTPSFAFLSQTLISKCHIIWTYIHWKLEFGNMIQEN